MSDRILIVEDDEAIAVILKEHLEETGYRVRWASDGKEALEELRMDCVDVILLDIMMPGMDGYTLCRNIRLINEDVPVIFVTAKQNDIDKVKGFDCGADDYITKPFSLVEVTARVQAIIRRSKRREGQTASNAALVFKNGLVIIPEERKVLINDKEIALTAREMDLLLLMAQNPNRVFTKGELYQNIWGSMDMEGNNTVTVHIKDIRDKLGDNSKNPYFIQTVWGTGYRFVG